MMFRRRRHSSWSVPQVHLAFRREDIFDLDGWIVYVTEGAFSIFVLVRWMCFDLHEGRMTAEFMTQRLRVRQWLHSLCPAAGPVTYVRHIGARSGRHLHRASLIISRRGVVDGYHYSPVVGCTGHSAE